MGSRPLLLLLPMESVSSISQAELYLPMWCVSTRSFQDKESEFLMGPCEFATAVN